MFFENFCYWGNCLDLRDHTHISETIPLILESKNAFDLNFTQIYKKSKKNLWLFQRKALTSRCEREKGSS